MSALRDRHPLLVSVPPCGSAEFLNVVPVRWKFTCKEHDVTIWFNAATGDVDSAWLEHGTADVSSRMRGKHVGDAHALMAAMNEEKLVMCHGCYELLDADKVAHRHFATRLCASCAPVYKERNSQCCTLCGRPYHSCVC